MPTNDPEYMRTYQRKRRARIDGEKSLAEYIGDTAGQGDVDAILEGVSKGTPEAWRKRRAAMDRLARKAIEPEQVKETNGKLSKGLGQLPGQPAPRPVPWSQPVPKPGKEKS